MVSVSASLLLAASLQCRAWGPYPPVAPFGMKALPNQRVVVPMIFPVVGKSRWRNSYGDRRQGFLHTGIDIQAPKMSPIVAPFAGTIGFKRMSFWIYGDNGWSVLGTHLNDDNPGKRDHRGSRDLMFAPNLVPGQRVRAGQLIGYVGQSGNATGPHLHFELYAPGKGLSMTRIRNPKASLHMAQRISAPLPMYVQDSPKKGTMRLQGCVRRVDAAHGHVTIALVSKQMPHGMMRCVSNVHYVRLRVSRAVAERAGGFAAMKAMPTTTPISVIVPATAKLDDAAVSKLFIPRSLVATVGAP